MDDRVAGGGVRRQPRGQFTIGGRASGNFATDYSGMKTPIRLIIADDHALFRGGLKSLLRRQRDMQVVGEADSAAALIATVAETSCDILLLDLQMGTLGARRYPATCCTDQSCGVDR
jgi:hypothetical protein